MKRATMFMDESLKVENKAISEDVGKSTSWAVREAMKGRVRAGGRKKRRLPFAALGSSAKCSVAGRHEEILRQG